MSGPRLTGGPDICRSTLTLLQPIVTVRPLGTAASVAEVSGMREKHASAQDVARLFGRAAFGATAADLDAWTGKPYADAVDHLVDVPPPLMRPPAPDDAE